MKTKATPGQIKYWLSKCKKFGFHVKGETKELDPYPYSSFQEIPVGPRYYVGKLITQGYNIQFKIR